MEHPDWMKNAPMAKLDKAKKLKVHDTIATALAAKLSHGELTQLLDVMGVKEPKAAMKAKTGVKEATEMKLGKLQALAEAENLDEAIELAKDDSAAMAKAADKPAMTAAQEDKIVRRVLGNAEQYLEHECRYKQWDSFPDTKIVHWITQESSDGEGKTAARTLASLIRKAGVKGWTVMVTVRDNGRGEKGTKWQGKAKS